MTYYTDICPKELTLTPLALKYESRTKGHIFKWAGLSPPSACIEWKHTVHVHAVLNKSKEKLVSVWEVNKICTTHWYEALFDGSAKVMWEHVSEKKVELQKVIFLCCYDVRNYNKTSLQLCLLSTSMCALTTWSVLPWYFILPDWMSFTSGGYHNGSSPSAWYHKWMIPFNSRQL